MGIRHRPIATPKNIEETYLIFIKHYIFFLKFKYILYILFCKIQVFLLATRLIRNTYLVITPRGAIAHA